jgi:DNA repair exonuclease SbcCD nuclease subunit
LSFRFLHAADIHLDSPLLSLEEYPGAPVEEIRFATRKALANLVDLAIETQVAFVIIAGDLFDGEWRDCNTGLHFVSQMKRLRSAAIPAYVSLGNHDAANRMTVALPWGENVHFFDYRKPERLRVPGCDAALVGQSFRNAHISEDLTASFPHGDSGLFNIGVLHTSCAGAPGHEPYAPCSLDALRSRRYEYWALGHIHARTELSKEPTIVFSGNTQGRSVRECGPRGCYLVEVDDGGGVSLRFEALDVVRWEVLRIATNGERSPADLESLIERAVQTATSEADGRTLAVRLEVEGCGPAWDRVAADLTTWTARLRALTQSDMPVPVHLEKVVLVPKAPDGPPPELDAGPAGEVRALIQELARDPALLSELRAGFAELKTKLDGVVELGDECPDPQDDTVLLSALQTIEPLLAGPANGTGAAR